MKDCGHTAYIMTSSKLLDMSISKEPFTASRIQMMISTYNGVGTSKLTRFASGTVIMLILSVREVSEAFKVLNLIPKPLRTCRCISSNDRKSLHLNIDYRRED